MGRASTEKTPEGGTKKRTKREQFFFDRPLLVRVRDGNSYRRREPTEEGDSSKTYYRSGDAVRVSQEEIDASPRCFVSPDEIEQIKKEAADALAAEQNEKAERRKRRDAIKAGFNEQIKMQAQAVDDRERRKDALIKRAAELTSS